MADRSNFTMAEVTYVPRDEPLDLGEDTHGHQMAYGTYRVVLGDGFTYLTAHTGYVGTVSVWPVDLDLNPHFREMLIEDAVENSLHIPLTTD